MFRASRVVAAIFAALCAVSADAQTFTPISSIMRNLPNSPELGNTRTIRGVVTAAFNDGTTYVVSLEGDKVGGGAVESIPVVGSAMTQCATPGVIVNVTGSVRKQPLQTAAGTEAVVLEAQTCTTTGLGSSQTMIGAVPIFRTYTDGMQDTGDTFNAFSIADVAPSSGKWDDATATMTPYSMWWGLPSQSNTRILRQPGIQPDEFVPASAPATVARSAGYPNLTIVDAQLGGSTYPSSYSIGANLVCSFTPLGVSRHPQNDMVMMDWTAGRRRLVFLPETQCNPTNPGFLVPTAYARLRGGSIGVSTLDLYRFYDDRSDVAGVPVVTTSGYQRRLAKAAMAAVDVFDLPHIFAVQEVKSAAALNDLASAIAAYASAKGKRAVGYHAYVFDGNSADHLNIGFLVDEGAALHTIAVSQELKTATYTTAAGGNALLWERPPVVLRVAIGRPRADYAITVINVHLTARQGIDDPVQGVEIRQHRKAQAESLAALVQQHQLAGERVMVVGNFNAYPFNDGYVDVVGTVRGAPASPAEVTLPTASSVSPALQVSSAVTGDAYNMYENGLAVQVEQVLITSNLAASTLHVQTHFTADFAGDYANDPTTPAGLTPHDGFFYDLSIPPPKIELTTPATTVAFGDQSLKIASPVKRLVFTAPVDNEVTIQFSAPSISGVAAGDFSYTTDCAALAAGQSCHVDIAFKPDALGARSATLLMSNDSNNAPAFRVALSGNGVLTATLAPAQFSFGDWSVGGTSTSHTFTWTNTTGAALTVAPSVSTAAFAISSHNCGTVAPLSTCDVNVVFKPAALGAASDVVTVVASYLGTPYSLGSAVTGNGVAPIVIDPALADFGNTDVGFASGVRVMTVRNTSANPVVITSIAAAADFAVTSHCGTQLAAHSSCLVDVVFHPTHTGAQTATLVATVVGYPVGSAALSGNGVDFSVAISPESRSVIAGLSTDVTAMIVPIAGFTGAVQLTCPPPADGAVCEPAARTVNLGSGTPVRVEVSTTAQYTVIGYQGLAGILGVLAALMLGYRTRRVRLAHMWIAAGMAILATALSGCSGRLPDRNSPFTHPGNYTVTLQVTDGKLTHSASFDLKVTATK